MDYRHSVDNIRNQAQKKGITKSRLWTKEEDDILINNYFELCMNEIISLLPGRTRDGIVHRAQKLNIAYAKYSKEDIDYIRNNYLKMSDCEIAKYLGRTRASIKEKRHKLKCLREPTYIVNDLSEYIRHHNYNWRQNSIEYFNLKHLTTKDSNIEIHHLYGFNLIVKDTLKRLKIDEDSIDVKDNKMMEYILEEFYIEQDKHPLGICLHKDIHKQFHNIYGYGNNTPDQFNEFLKQHTIQI